MSKNIKEKFPVRLKILRLEKEISQQFFAEELSIFMGRGRQFSLSAISSWELGTKTPNYKTLTAIANYFGVCIEYLTGESDKRFYDSPNKSLFMLNDYTTEISDINLQYYDGKPVFLVFDNKEIENCWSIYNADKNYFCCRDQIYRKSGGMRYFAVDDASKVFSFSEPENKPLDLEGFKNKNFFWVEYYGSTQEINNRFSGWYSHTETKSGIINREGNILPYEGLNIYYHVYKDKY